MPSPPPKPPDASLHVEARGFLTAEQPWVSGCVLVEVMFEKKEEKEAELEFCRMGPNF